jgi:hypothetical protein
MPKESAAEKMFRTRVQYLQNPDSVALLHKLYNHVLAQNQIQKQKQGQGLERGHLNGNGNGNALMFSGHKGTAVSDFRPAGKRA